MSRSNTDISIVSWNIHRARGQDGVVDPARIADVMKDEVLDAATDLLVLQEADQECRPHHGILDIADIEARTGLRYLHGDVATRWSADSHGFLGIILFAGPRITVETITLLDLPGHCHRGAVIADLRSDGCVLRVVGMHLSLTQVLRVVQLRTVGQHLMRRAARPTVLCGDLNEWRPWGGLAFSQRVLGQSFAGPAKATFPVGRPVLPLDRVLAAGGARVSETRVLDGPGIRVASDHRPLRAQVEVTRV